MDRATPGHSVFMTTSRWCLGLVFVAGCGGGVADVDRQAGPANASPTSSVATRFVIVNTDPSLCMPRRITRDAADITGCRMLEVLAARETCSAHPGLSDADPALAEALVRTEPEAVGTVCELAELVPSACAATSSAGWCYVEGAAAGPGCEQALRFTATQPVAGARVAIGCPEPL